MYTDIHSHIIPEVDDGACNMEESLQLLETMAAQGITSLIATPHFYAEDNHLTPLQHSVVISKKLAELKEYVPAEQLPLIKLGHEVHYFNGISTCEEVLPLCFKGGKHFLLELPYNHISSSVVTEIVDFSLNFGVKPILAHIERYVRHDVFPDLLKIVEEGFAEAQLNCDSVIDKRLRRVSLDLIKQGFVSYLATDAHNTYDRPPRYREAVEIILKKIGRKEAQVLQYNAARLFEETEE